MEKRLLEIMNRMENYKISLSNWLIAFFCITYARAFLEFTTDKKHTLGLLTESSRSIFHIFVYWNLEWMALFLGIVLILHLFSKEKIVRLSKITLVFYIWILLPILINLLAYGSNTKAVEYLFSINDYIRALKFFFVFNININISIGVRLEVFGAVILTFFYVYLKTHNLFRSMFAAVAIYFIAISSMCFPAFALLFFFPMLVAHGEVFSAKYIDNFFSASSLPYTEAGKYSLTILLFVVCFIIIIFLLYNWKIFTVFIKSVFSDIKTYIFTALFFIGFYMAIRLPVPYIFFDNIFDLFYVISCFMLSVLVCLPSIFLSAKNSTRIKKHLKGSFGAILTIAVLISAFFAFSVSYEALLVMLFIYALYFFYYAPPFELNKYPVLNVLMPASICFLFLFEGFTAVKAREAIRSFPLTYFIFIYGSLICAFALKQAFTAVKTKMKLR